MVVAERRIDSEIEREVAELLKMGVEVPPIKPERDAGPEYERLVETLSKEWAESGISEQTLSSLEVAGRKPFATLEPAWHRAEGLIPNCLSDEFRKAEAKKDFARMKRIWQIGTTFEVQVAGGDTTRYMFFYRIAQFLPRPAVDELEVLAWHREELENYDYLRLVRAQLSSYGRDCRSPSGRNNRVPPGAYVVHNPAPPSKPWWEKAVESQVMFRKAGELEMLRSLRRVSAKALQSPPWETIDTDYYSAVCSDLDQQDTWSARWAKEQRVAPWNCVLGNEPSLDLRYSLIILDLMESRARHLPLKPTWSKKYCVDPTDGSPLKVTVTKTELAIHGASSVYSTPW